MTSSGRLQWDRQRRSGRFGSDARLGIDRSFNREDALPGAILTRPAASDSHSAPEAAPASSNVRHPGAVEDARVDRSAIDHSGAVAVEVALRGPGKNRFTVAW
jgi:hypothetical protein